MMSCVIISSFKRREFFRTGTSNLLKNGLSVVACTTHLVWSVCGLWSMATRQGRASTIYLSLYSITCIPSIVVSAFESCALRSLSAAALGDRELRHWHKTNNARKVLARRPSSLFFLAHTLSLPRYCIERVWNHIHTQHVSLRLGQRFCSCVSCCV